MTEAFLENVTDRTMELKMGNLINYKETILFTSRRVQLEKRDKRKAYVSQKKEIEKKKEFINRFRSNIKRQPWYKAV